MAFKSALYGSNYFESMGLTYLGPIDGNDREATEKLLAQAKKLNESVIVHVKTKKGKGYEPAESSPASYHGMPPRDVELSDGESFSTVVGHTLAELGRTDERICTITAAMSDGTGLEICRTAFPERFFDVGIAEEHALTFAAGLAANGMRPCAAIYSTFLQRGYDNIIHDIALQKLPVTMLIDRAGLNAKDGATHHGIFDVAFLSHIPNISIYTPVTYRGLIASMKKAIENGEPAAIRYPSGNEKSAIIDRFYKNGGFEDIGVKLDYSLDAAPDAIIVTHGRIALEAMRVADELALEGVKVGIMLLEKLKPYSESAELVKRNIPDGTKALLFLEEEIRSGGAGMNLCDKLAASLEGREIKHAILAVDDSFVAMGEQGKSILQTAGIDACAIKKTINDII
jgi:1-deoxy-D-xylulose-5-phosphate synthase